MQAKDEYYQTRNYCASDWQGYVHLFATAEAAGEEEYFGLSPQQLLIRLEHGNNSPEKNLFIIKKDRNIMGCLYIVPEDGINRIVFYCFVHPSYRRKGIGVSLFNQGFKRAQGLGLNRVHVNIKCDNVAAKSFLSRLGFRCVRKYLELQKKIVERHAEVTDLPVGFYFGSLQDGEEGILNRLQNKAFRGSWGFNPHTVEDVIDWLHFSGGSAADIILALWGEEPAGYCWTQMSREKGRGRIHMIGVESKYRHKKLGKALLATGLDYLEKKGIHTVVLTVDSNNKPARNLYHDLGFKVMHTTLWYEKKLD